MIIGICGFQGSGKDTVADYLVTNYGFEKLSFASALKDVVSAIFGWPRDKLEGITKEDRQWREEVDPWWAKELKIVYLTPRYVLRYFGTELFRRHWMPDIWVKVIERKIVNLVYQKNIVVTDCRFENEINMLLRYGGKIVHVHRNLPCWFYKYKNGERVEDVFQLHESEVAWIRCSIDTEIENDGTIIELYEKINILYEKLLKDNF